MKTLEAIIDEHGNVRLLEAIRPGVQLRALVTILDEVTSSGDMDPALLSEASLAGDWNRDEEDEAWAHLQEAKRTLKSFTLPSAN